MTLMFIGASPGGTGGGIKTTTVAALMAATRSTLRGQDHVRERSFESEVSEREFQSGATTSAPTTPRGLVLVDKIM